MDKDKLSTADIETLMEELGDIKRRDEQDAALIDMMCRVAGEEIHRIYRRRRWLRLAGCTVAALGLTVGLLT